MVRASAGCRTAKVKVAEPGQTETDDLARVEAVRDALGGDGRVRVDANGGWDVDTAVRMVALLDRVGLVCRAAVPDRRRARRGTPAGRCADRGRRVDPPGRGPAARRQAGGGDIAVLKVQPLGGVAACLRVAEQIGLPVVVSSALESSVGIAVGSPWRLPCPSCPMPAASRRWRCSTATSPATRSLSSTVRLPCRAPSRTGRASSPQTKPRCAGGTRGCRLSAPSHEPRSTWSDIRHLQLHRRHP